MGTIQFHYFIFLFFLYSIFKLQLKDANNKNSPDSGYPNDDPNMPEKGFYENLPFHGIHSANKNVSKYLMISNSDDQRDLIVANTCHDIDNV